MQFRTQLYQNFVSRGFYFLSVFVLNIALARFYEAAQSGWINYISNNFAFAITFGSLSLEVAVLYFGSAQIISKEKLATFSFLWSLLLSGVFYGITTLFLNKADNIASKGLLQFGATSYFIGIIITNFFMNLFVMQKNYVLPNILLCIMNLLLIFLMPHRNSEWVIFDRETFLYVYYFWFVLQGVVLIIAYYLSLGKIRFHLLSKLEFKKMVGYASSAFWGNVSFFLLTKVDYWLVEKYCAASELGNYIQASKLGQTLLLFGMITATSVFVHNASSNEWKKNVLQIFKFTRIFFLFFLLVFLLILLLGKPLLPFIFGHTFQWIYLPLLALIPGILFLSIIVLIGAFFGANHWIRYSTYANSIGIVFIVLINWVLLKKYGIVFASIISSVGYLITLIFYFLFLYKKVPFRISEIWSGSFLKKNHLFQ